MSFGGPREGKAAEGKEEREEYGGCSAFGCQRGERRRVAEKEVVGLEFGWEGREKMGAKNHGSVVDIIKKKGKKDSKREKGEESSKKSTAKL